MACVQQPCQRSGYRSEFGAQVFGGALQPGRVDEPALRGSDLRPDRGVPRPQLLVPEPVQGRQGGVGRL
jgi:hypothetical protein